MLASVVVVKNEKAYEEGKYQLPFNPFIANCYDICIRVDSTDEMVSYENQK